MTINKLAAQSIVDHYTDCLSKHKGTPNLEVDWGKNPKDMQIRNNTILDIIYSHIDVDSNIDKLILDVGCGTGHFYNHLVNENCWDGSEYTGCDASLEMVEEVRNRYPDAMFFHLPIGEHLKDTYEILICNGVFTEKRDLSKWEMYWEVLIPTLKMLLEHTNTALIVNFMNSHSIAPAKQRDELFFLDSNELANLAAELGIKKYTIKAGYLQYEHLICMEK